MRLHVRLGLTFAGAALLLSLVPATASAGTGGGYTSTPDSGPAGTTVTVSSTEPCPAPPTGHTIQGVAVLAGDEFRVVGTADLTVNPDRSWAGSVRIQPGTRNGWYIVQPICVYSDNSVRPYPGHEFIVSSAAGAEDPVVRVAGNDRIATALNASKDLVPAGQVTSVVLSRSDSYADALAGTPLATVLRAPLLLTGQGALDPRVEAELKRVLVAGGEVHLLGGTAALSPAVATRISSLGFEVVRYAGTNRYDTAVKVASIGVQEPTAVLLATGRDFRDGLVAGVAAPQADPTTAMGFGVVLLTDGRTMPAETRAYLESLGGVPTYAVGADAAAAAPSAVRLAGADHAGTSVLVAERFFPKTNVVGIASTGSFADALAGGAHIANKGEPLLLTNPGSLPASVSGFISARKAAVVIGFVYGGTAAVSEPVRTAVTDALN